MACQYTRPGFSRNWDKVVMVYAMSGPISSGSLYGVFTISSVASSALSDWAFNRRCLWSSDVLIMLAPFILILTRTKTMYAPWHRDSAHFSHCG